MSTPVTIGRIVLYALTADDIWNHVEDRSNMNAHAVGQKLPAIVVGISTMIRIGEVANLRVFLDGDRMAWIQGAPEGDGPGKWSWPPREPSPVNEDIADIVKEATDGAMAAARPLVAHGDL